MDETFEEKKKKQLDNLAFQIFYGEHKDYFYVVNIEAGLRKTLTVEETLFDIYKHKPDIKTLFVKKFSDVPNLNGIDDIADIAEAESKTSMGRINAKSRELFSKDIAIAIDSSNYDEYRDKLKYYPIVIITHQMYLVLSQNTSKRKVFADGRCNLIIDEEVDIVKALKYDEERIKLFRGILPKQLIPYYNLCIKDIEKELQNV